METKNIYKLFSSDRPELVYYGSTKQKLNRRLSKHKCDFKRWREGKNKSCPMSRLIFQNSNIENVKIELMEVVEDLALERERYYIETYECINKNIPSRTNEEYKDYQKEYRDANRDKINKQQKEYYEANREKKKEYYEANREKLNKKYICSVCGGSFTTANKMQHEKTQKHIKALPKPE